MAKIEKTIGLLAGTSYCVTVIVGAGILGLPGVAAQLSGANAPLAWLLDFFLAIPLLFVFGKLITRAQSAGGIADFIKIAFGSNRLFRFSQVLLLMTLIVGTAAISLVGADYLSSSFGISGIKSALLGVALILVPTLINSFGVKIGGRIQSVLAGTLISFLVFVILSSLSHWNLESIHTFDSTRILGTWKSMGLIWFAFTGVEMISFLGEDFKSPKSFILSVVTAFLIVGFLYIGLAVALKEAVSPNNLLLQKSPLVAILESTLGAGIGRLGGIFGFILILINQCGAILGASRLVFSVGREGILLPQKMGNLDKNGVPQLALWSLATCAVLTVLIISFTSLSLEPLFEIVSQNWFLLYVLAIASFLKLSITKLERIFGVLALLLASVFMSSFSWYLFVPAILFIITSAIPFKTEPSNVG